MCLSRQTDSKKRKKRDINTQTKTFSKSTITVTVKINYRVIATDDGGILLQTNRNSKLHTNRQTRAGVLSKRLNVLSGEERHTIA